MRSFHLLVNRRSGGGAATVAGIAVARRLRDAGARVNLTYSSSVEQSCDLVRVAVAADDVVVAVGGDGMIASVVSDVVAAGGILGIVPGGRGNDFARQLGLASDHDAAAQVLLNGSTRQVDVIEAGERLVCGSVYAGVDSKASEIVNDTTWLPGSLQYPYAAVRALVVSKTVRYKITIDGSVLDADAFTVIVANSGYYGNGMHIAPAAIMDDGMLDIIVIGTASRYRLIRAMPKLYDGSHVDLPEVTVLKGREITIESAENVMAYGDGERLQPLPLTATVRPAALTVLT